MKKSDGSTCGCNMLNVSYYIQFNLTYLIHVCSIYDYNPFLFTFMFTFTNKMLCIYYQFFYIIGHDHCRNLKVSSATKLFFAIK